MKNLLHLALVLFVALAFVGCDSDDVDDPGNAPTATADTGVTAEGTAVEIDVLDNDTDPEGGDLTITAVSDPANGTAEVISNGTAVRYTPDAGFPATAASANDTFTYTVRDEDGNTATGTVTVGVNLNIVGTWVSEGDDIAPGLVATFGTTRIEAVFNADGSYVVEEDRGATPAPTLTGNFSIARSASGDIRSITLDQNAPTELQAQGIYEIADGTMRYEVIQVDPALPGGTWTAPTPETGFGGTAFNGTPLGNTWIQTYVEVE